jgi:hypothetical protein
VPLAALAAAALLAAAARAGPLAEAALGPAAVPLRAELEVRTRAGELRRPLCWEEGADGSLTARVAEREWEAVVSLAPLGEVRALSADVRWLAPAEVEQIALVLTWPGEPQAVGRALRFQPFQGPLRVERGTPLLVATGELVLAGGPGLAAAEVARVPEGTRVTLLLDDAAARPFSTFETCFERLPTPALGQHLAWGSFDPRRPVLLAPRAAGDEDRLGAALFPRAPRTPFHPVVVERWPRGAEAAVVLTDHADRTDPEALRAVLWGDSRRDAGLPGSGLLGRGLAVTRTFFVHGREGSLDDPLAFALAGELAAAGSEVALHSITDERDGREAVRAGLGDAAPFAPRTWIDHEPYTNCEALSAQGWRADGPYGIRDLLGQAGIQWIWAAGDEGRGTPRVYDVLGGASDEVRAAIAPFPLDPRLWMFRSSMFYASPAALSAALSDAELLALERERGLFVAHTYLGASVHTTHTPEHLARLAVRAGPRGGLVIDPDLDAALSRLQAHVQAGRLASLTWREAGDRLRALSEVVVRYLPDGAAEVLNLGASDLPGLTLAIPAPPGVEITVDGVPAASRADEEDELRLWLDLPAGGRALLRATDGLAPLPLLAFP